MNKLKYPLVFSDYDDTLTLSDGTITPRTLRAIKAYRNAGGTFVVCTGRNHPSVKKLLPKVYGEENPRVPVICYQGGLTVDSDGNVLRRVAVNKADLIRLTAELEQRKIVCQTYSGEKMFCSRMTAEARKYEKITDCEFTVVGDLPEFMRAYDGEFDKLLLIAPPEEVQKYYKEFTERGDFPDFKFTYSRPNYLEAIPKASGKDTAIRFLADHLGVAIDRTVAFGDSNNDVDMLTTAGLGIAVGNAREECKASADLIAEPNTEDGLAKVLESLS